MSKPCPTVRIQAEDGRVLIRDGLHVCFYIHRSHREIVQDVIRSLEVYLRAVGSGALGWYADEEGDWQELDERGWAHFRSQMQQSGALIHLKDTPRGAGPYKFEYSGKDLSTGVFAHDPNAVCALEFWLPTEFLEERGAEAVRALALDLAAPLPFSSGHAGFSFNALQQLVGVSDEIRRLRSRYPGLDVPGMGNPDWHIGSRVRGPHWLTFLGSPVLAELGGAAGLRSRLASPDISVHSLDDQRVLLTLGPEPDAGDTTLGHRLPLHREVARLLEPWLFHAPPLRDPVSSADTLLWERRFLD